MQKTVAVLGLGTMGAGMAKNLLKAGYPTKVYNRTRARAEAFAEQGARVCDTPGQAAQDADVVISMLADDAASRSAWLGDGGALSNAKPGAVLIECSTVTPQWIEELSEAAERAKHGFLDAPVTGSRAQAEGGQLSFLVGGDAAILETVGPVLHAMGQNVTHLGKVGSGARMKLINNFLCGVQAASLAEGLVWIERSGLDRQQALEVLKKGAPGSPLFAGISGRMVEGTYGINFLLPLMRKDLHYAQQDAERFGVCLRTAATAETRFEDAVQAGFGEKDMSAVIEPLRNQKQVGT